MRSLSRRFVFLIGTAHDNFQRGVGQGSWGALASSRARASTPLASDGSARRFRSVTSVHPAAGVHIAYLQAVQACSRRYSWKSDSVRVGKSRRQAALKARAGLGEVGGDPALELAVVGSRVEATGLFPSIDAKRDARPHADHAYLGRLRTPASALGRHQDRGSG